MSATRAASRPNLPSAEAALDFVMAAIEKAGYAPGEDVALALDPASSEFFKDGAYRYEGEGKTRSIEQQVEYLAELVERYPIVSIEDGMAEDDFDGWKKLTQKIGDECQLVGDDVFVTNVARLTEGIKNGIANSILIKVNQIGTLTETLAAVEIAHKAGYTAVMSHRSGETEDYDHRRPRGRHQLRADQDRLAGALRPHREIQPAPAHRGGTRAPRRYMPGARRSRRLLS